MVLALKTQPRGLRHTHTLAMGLWHSYRTLSNADLELIISLSSSGRAAAPQFSDYVYESCTSNIRLSEMGLVYSFRRLAYARACTVVCF